MSDLIAIEHGIQALLSPLMGTPGKGTLTAVAVGAEANLPAGSVAVPVGDGDFDEHAAVFVARNPATTDGSWPVGQGGTAVKVESLQGGPVGNHPASTTFRWFPVPDGIVETCQSSEIAGGVAETSLGSLRQLRMVKQFEPNDWSTFLHAQLGDFPGAALVWESIVPVDGPNFAAQGPRTARMGSTGMKYANTWAIYLVTSRLDSATHRRAEGQILIQNVIRELQGRQSGRGLRISQAPGVQVVQGQNKSATPVSFVDVVRFQTTVVVKDKTSEAGNPWLRTRVVVQKNETGDQRAPLENPDINLDMRGT